MMYAVQIFPFFRVYWLRIFKGRIQNLTVRCFRCLLCYNQAEIRFNKRGVLDLDLDNYLGSCPLVDMLGIQVFGWIDTLKMVGHHYILRTGGCLQSTRRRRTNSTHKEWCSSSSLRFLVLASEQILILAESSLVVNLRISIIGEATRLLSLSEC